MSCCVRLNGVPGADRASIALALLLVLPGCTSQDESTGPWSLAGETVGLGQIESSAGPEHCEWQDAHFLSVAWPPNSDESSTTGRRQYIRDPEGVLPQTELQERFLADAELPADARTTGYQNDGWELWFAASDDSATAYLVTDKGNKVEAWPRDTTGVACA